MHWVNRHPASKYEELPDGGSSFLFSSTGGKHPYDNHAYGEGKYPGQRMRWICDAGVRHSVP